MIYHTCIIWYIRAENIQISECLQVLSTTIPNIACLLICDALRTELHRSVLPPKRLVFKNSLTRKKIKCISVMIWVSIWGLSCLSFFAYTGQIVWIEWFDLYWAYACLEQSKGLNTLALVPAHRGIRMVSKKIAFEARPSMPWKPGQVGSKLLRFTIISRVTDSCFVPKEHNRASWKRNGSRNCIAWIKSLTKHWDKSEAGSNQVCGCSW